MKSHFAPKPPFHEHALATRLPGEAAPEPEIARRCVETKLVIEAAGAAADDRDPDPALMKAVARGPWFEVLVSGRAESISAIARREGVTPRYVSRLLELAFLPPQLAEAILEGRQPADMTAEALTRGGKGSGAPDAVDIKAFSPISGRAYMALPRKAFRIHPG